MLVHFKKIIKNVFGLMVYVIKDYVNMLQNHFQHMKNVKNLEVIVQQMGEDV